MKSFRSKAFTLLEVLVVITIIGVLTSLLVLNFQGVRAKQELALLADQSQAMLQQMQSEVRGGKVFFEADEEASSAVYLCQGAFFEAGSRPLLATASYDADEALCDMSTLQTEPYGISTGAASVATLTVDGVDYADQGIYVLFSPPEAALIFYDGLNSFEGEGEMTFQSSLGEISESLVLTLSSQVDLVYLSTLILETTDEE